MAGLDLELVMPACRVSTLSRPGVLLAVGLTAGASAAAEPTSCTQCHELIEGTVGGSVHGRGNAGCIDCHGGNPEPRPDRENEKLRKAKAHDPKKGFAKQPDGVCAKCHEQAAAAFDAGPHGASLKAKASPRCWDCHAANPAAPSVHDLVKPTLALFTDTCVRCHADRPDLVAMGGGFKAMFETAHEAVEGLPPPGQGPPDPRMDEYHEALRVQHGLDRKEIAARTASIAGRMPVERPLALAWLAALWTIVIALLAMATVKLKRLQAEEP